MRFFSGLLVLVVCTSCVSAEPTATDRLLAKLMPKLPGLTANDIRESEVPGLYEIRKGAVFAYVTGDGKFLIQGDLVNLETGEELTEQRRMQDRLRVLNKLGPDNMIEFAPKDTRYAVTVFTDIDCGYCRKLHREMADYADKGIAIRYLFYPRSGPNTPSFEKAQQVWCSADRRDAMTQAKQGQPLKSSATCAGNGSIARQYQAGEDLGINATPMMILPDGDLVRGYVPANALAARLTQGGWAGVN